MKERVAEEESRGNPNFTHFNTDANELEVLDEVFADYGRMGIGRTRTYVHDDDEAALYGCAPGTFTPWRDFAPSDLLFYEGLHGCAVTDKINLAHHADLKIGVVPVINLEWIQKIHRDRSTRGYSTEAVMDIILRRMPDYVRYIVPAVRPDQHQLPARADRRHVEPVHCALDTDAGRIDAGDPLRQSARHRFSLPAVDDPRLLHVARRTRS